MKFYSGEPYLKCGEICKGISPHKTEKKYKPINLTFVKVNTKDISQPHALINYSQNLEFEFKGFNPKLSIVYRLIRKDEKTGFIKVLDCWNYKVSEIIPTTVEKLNTIEPLVLNFCDCLGCEKHTSFTYIIQISEIISENTSFIVTNQQMSAIVSCGECNN